jgi:hypothetical protein
MFGFKTNGVVGAGGKAAGAVVVPVPPNKFGKANNPTNAFIMFPNCPDACWRRV